MEWSSYKLLAHDDFSEKVSWSSWHTTDLEVGAFVPVSKTFSFAHVAVL